MAIRAKKSLILTGIRILLNFGASFADDCHLFNEGDPYTEGYKNQLAPLYIGDSQKENKMLNLLPKETLETAFRNLHASCCASNRSSSTICNKKGSLDNRKKRKNFPESNYLFDHLVDIQLRRRLHTNTGENAYPNFPADELAKERYETLEKIIKQAEGVLPTKINKEYKKYRGMQSDFLLPGYQGESPQEYRKLIEYFINPNKDNQNTQNKNHSFKDRNLSTKLQNTCSTASYLNILLSSDQQKSTTIQSAQKSCKKLITNQLNQQNTMITQSIAFKSNKLTSDTLKNYSNYFTKRLNHLQTQLVETTTKLQGVARQVTKLVPRCN